MVNNNLPQQLTSFIGREREIAEIKRLLSTTRLLTLTGMGGSGKTRLAIQVASDLSSEYPAGAWFVDLAALSDADFVPQAVASAVGLREELGSFITPMLLEYIRPRKLLLVLDNCEHLVAACAELADTFLRECPELTLLATSREILGLSGEVAWPVPPLASPDPTDMVPLASLAGYEAVQLFVVRATFSRPSFKVTVENSQAIAELCRQLDGLPLALELAAARVKVLSVEQIVTRLDERFKLLTSNGSNARPHQQTLLALMNWSYDLLPDQEQALLRALAVFAGGFSLEAIQAVCAVEIDEYEVIDLLGHLVDKSLVVMEEKEGEARYRLLETVRQYALDKLKAKGEMLPTYKAYNNWCLQLAVQARQELVGSNQIQWLNRLELEHDNLRAVLDWSVRVEQNAEVALLYCCSLWRFWNLRGYLSEGRSWVDEALELSNEANSPTDMRARTFSVGGILAWLQGDYSRAVELQNEALALRRSISDKTGMAVTLCNLGIIARESGDYDRALNLYGQSVELYRELNDTVAIARVLDNLGYVRLCQGNFELARELCTEALDVLRDASADDADMVIVLTNLGEIACAEDKCQEAVDYYDQALAVAQELGDKLGMVDLLNNLANAAICQEDYATAAAFYRQSLAISKKLWYRQGIAQCLEGLALVSSATDYDRSVRLFAASDTLRKKLSQMVIPWFKRVNYDEHLVPAKANLDQGTFTELWTSGKLMSVEEAVDFALEHEESAGTKRHPNSKANGNGKITSEQLSKVVTGELCPFDLTKRELQILRLVASGMTDAEIAGDLTLSPRTVNAHLHNVYSKLEVNSRGAATSFAIRNGLV